MTATTFTWWEGDIKRVDRKDTVVTADYYSRLVSGQILPDNPYLHTGEWIGSDYLRTITQIWNNTAKEWRTSYVNDRRLEAPGIGLDTFSWSPPEMQFLSKVKTQSVSVITMMAERKKTASLLKDLAANTLYTLIHWRKPKKVLSRWLKTDVKIRKWAMRRLERRILRCTSPAEAWLEYRFAIRPLMYDIRDALEAFEKGSKKQHLVHVSAKDIVYGNKVQKGLGPYGTVTGMLNSEYRWKIVGRFRVVDPSLAALGNLAGVSASLWDLLPFSFVIDWAWDISRWLDLQNATLGLQYVSGFKGLKTTYQRRYTAESRNVSSTKRYIAVGGYGATWTSVYYARTVMTSCPTPSILVGSAGEIFRVSRIVDMLALARQIYSGKVKSTYHFSN